MRILHAGEDRELTARSEMDLELPHAVDDVIVDTLAVAPGGHFLARLPVAFQDVLQPARGRVEARLGRLGGRLEAAAIPAAAAPITKQIRCRTGSAG